MQTPRNPACQSTRLCKWCNKPFSAKQARVQYCSKRCSEPGKRAEKLNGTHCQVCGKKTWKLSVGGTCSKKCAARKTAIRKRNAHPKLDCLKCHGAVGLKCKESARLLRVSHKIVYENRRRLGLRVLTPKEANRNHAIRSGRARPHLWGIKNPTTIEEWQAWAYRQDQKEWTEFASTACWSRDNGIQKEMARLAYYRDHEKNKAIRREVAKRRYYRLKHTPEFKVKQIMRNVLARIARKVSFRKTQRTHEYLGCTMDQARRHIEKQFRKGMSWNNHGEWELDHIVPLAKWDLTNLEHIKRANHYTNLQPLWKQENRAKAARIIGKHQMALL